jgi:FkbM family methyltransferase
MRGYRRILTGLKRRSSLLMLKARLSILHRIKRGDLVVDYGWIKLPYANDGDLQDLYYHKNCVDWHRIELNAIQKHVSPGDSVIDIGANQGFMTAIFSSLVGPGGKVLSFEPSPRTFRKLQRTISANQLANVDAHNVGIGNEAGQMELSTAESSGNSTLVHQSMSNGVAETVQIVTLDDFLTGHSGFCPKLVKIDTEGFEPFVLQGARHTLEKHRPLIYIELSDEFAESSRQAIAILQEMQYEIPSCETMSEIPLNGNYLLIPKEITHIA